MQRAFQKLTANPNVYFAEALDNFCTLRTQNPAAAAAAISSQRKTDMTKLGALVALMIIGGWTPGSLEPLFVYFLVYECNFDCLTPEIVEEWHPQLARMIKQWIQVGPEGDITPFGGHLMSYHEMQVSLSTHIPSLQFFILTFQPSALTNRDSSTHSAYAAIFLARAVIGTEDCRHPELAAFIEGFALRSPANNFTMQKVRILSKLYTPPSPPSNLLT